MGGEKVSLGKYQQTVFNARRTLHLFPLKGFFFGIAARKHGLNAMNEAKKEKPVKAAPVPDIVVGAPVLAQSRVSEDNVTINSVNQLDRAAQTYNNLQHMHKAFLATSVLVHTADYHSKQAKALRSNDGNRTWELDQLNGGSNLHVQRTIKQIEYVKNYSNSGIEQSWRPMTIDQRTQESPTQTTRASFCGRCVLPQLGNGNTEAFHTKRDPADKRSSRIKTRQ